MDQMQETDKKKVNFLGLPIVKNNKALIAHFR